MRIVEPVKNITRGIVLTVMVFGFLALSGIALKADELSAVVQVGRAFSNGTYLVLLQNSAELRPTGGFIGSFATLNVRAAKLERVRFETNVFREEIDFYNRTKIPAPKPLQAFGHPFGFQDMNWAADFSESARYLEWGYHLKYGGEPLDGVIALDPNLTVTLLRYTGSVDLPEQGLSLTSDTFLAETQYQVEKQYSQDPLSILDNEPKTILSAFLPLFLQKVQQLPPATLLRVLKDNLREKHVLLYHNNQNVETTITDLGWGGVIPAGAIFAPVNANIKGLKSSTNVTQDLDITITTKGNALTVEGSLVRTHTNLGRWLGSSGVNNNYLRLLLDPAAHNINVTLNAQNVPLDRGSEARHAMVGAWVNTAPGKSNVLKFNYTMPLTNRITFVRQPGTQQETLRVTIDGKVQASGNWTKDFTLSLPQ